MLPKMIPDKPSPFNLDLTKKAPSASPAVGKGTGGDVAKAGGSDSSGKGIGSVINGLFETLSSAPPQIGEGQVGMLGDFDAEQFVESTLKAHQGKKEGGGGIGEIIGSLIKMIGGGG